MKKYLLILFAISLVLSACSAKDSSALLTGSWKLMAYGRADGPRSVVPDTQAQITFNNDGSVNGNSGCNGFGGTYTVTGDQIAFSEIVSTLMACDNPRMVQEDAVHQVLTDAATFKIEGNTLTLMNNGGVLVLMR